MKRPASWRLWRRTHREPPLDRPSAKRLGAVARAQLTLRILPGSQTGHPLRVGQNAVQQAQFALVHLRPLIQLAQAQHHSGRRTTLVEVDLVQRLRKMGVELLHLRRVRQRFVLNDHGGGQIGKHRQAKFVGHHLHGLSEVERAVIVVAGNAHHGVAARQLVVLQTSALVTEHQRHVLAACRGGQRLRGRFARRHLRQGHAAPAGRQSQHQPAADQAVDQFGVDAGLLEYVACAGRQRRGLGIGKARRPHQLQPGKAHGADGPCRAADIARMRSAHQHMAYA
jgi:hypothetical protein